MLQGDAGIRVEAFRRLHEPSRAGLVPAHVTLVFGVAAGDGSALVRHAADCAAASCPIDLSFDAVRDFSEPGDAGFKLFVMVGQGREALCALHRALYRGQLAGQRRDDLPFEPHMTVASCSDRHALDRARSGSTGLGLPLAGRVDSIVVAALERDGLHGIAQLPLGGPSRQG